MYSYSHQRGTGYGGASQSIPLPPGMSPGAIIGKGGSNIKLLQSRSGARVSVNANSGSVDVSGTPAAVEEAVRLLWLQIDAFTATGGAYPHPLQVHYLLDDSFGHTSSATVTFKAASGEVAMAADRPEQLYMLQSAGAAVSGGLAPAGAAASSSGVSDLLAGLSLGPSVPCGPVPWVMLAGQREQFLQVAATAAQQAFGHRPHFDEMKLRFNFGKNFFYKGPTVSSSWTVQQLQRKNIPNDMKSVFSNAVTARMQAGLVAWLRQQGFTEVERKKTASVHLVQCSTNAGYALSFIKSGGSLSLRKLKSSNTKLAFGTLLNGTTSPDWRFKLLAQYLLRADPATKQLLTGIAHAASSTGSNSINLPGLAAADLVKDKERHKDKTIYHGTWRGSRSRGSTSVKVTVSTMYDATHRRSGYEVAGTSPELQQLLQQLLKDGRLSSGEEQLIKQHLANIVEFAQAATRCMVA